MGQLGQEGGDLQQKQQQTTGPDPTVAGNGDAPAAGNGNAPAAAGNGQAPAAAGNGHAPAGPGDNRPPGSDEDRAPGRHHGRLIAITTAIAVVLAGGGAYLATRGGGQPASAPSSGQAAVGPSGPLRVMSFSPASGAQQVDGSQPIRVTFSAPLASGSPRPTLTPHVAGSWQPSGNQMVFTPSQPLSPSTQYRVTLPAGMRSAAGGQLAGSATTVFTTEPYSQMRLAELLGQLGYLPMTWQQLELGTRAASAEEQSASTLSGQEALAYDPPAGVFTWQQGYPASLVGQWQPGAPNVILTGAVMAFQSQHNMNIDGSLTPGLWNALFQADLTGASNANGYTYAVANKGSPETLTIWHNGQQVLQSLANTGIAAAPTVDGTFPVYERFLNTIMSGTNPDGSTYSDPVQFVSYFNGGDAVHYFARGSYGFPQSLGCVELPYSDAEQAYPLLTYGSLVTVQG